MGRFWSLLFLSFPILGTAIFVWSAMGWYPLEGYWFPELVVADDSIDHLFYVILWMTGFVFIGTGIAMFWFLWKYDGKTYTGPVWYSHGSHLLEIIWSVIPAVIILFLAIYQMDAWAGARMRRPMLENGQPKPPIARVTGRQFEWKIQYPGDDKQFDTPDDLYTTNELHVPRDEEVVLEITSEDVLHSFFLPNFREKQDVVPGMKQYIWFKPVKDGKYDIVCAELCGWGHYKMKGQITVESSSDYRAWLKKAYDEQELSEYSLAEAE
ncbi:cytochrome c oxidase subunit II [Bremerella alba]|uniref:Cytochrome c oxidase subunit 2 n=1 Tax=Bremerella alba TaxID=980252 RepID=A0A7V9A8R3_9BACT|nr:cytochrome c oxidase subunit II [Bremerella alba]MBA2116558.1 Alternative cytochrome c oxidase subunit 2 [Bremerella alba]